MISRIGAMRSDGASAVEFALLLPLLIMLLFGIVEFGFIFMDDLGVSNAARQGARIGVQDGNTCQDVQASIYGGSGTLTMTPASDPWSARLLPSETPVCDGSMAALPCENADEGERLEVTVTYTGASLDIPLVPIAPFDLVRDAVFRCEYSAP